MSILRRHMALMASLAGGGGGFVGSAKFAHDWGAYYSYQLDDSDIPFQEGDLAIIVMTGESAGPSISNINWRTTSQNIPVPHVIDISQPDAASPAHFIGFVHLKAKGSGNRIEVMNAGSGQWYANTTIVLVYRGKSVLYAAKRYSSSGMPYPPTMAPPMLSGDIALATGHLDDDAAAVTAGPNMSGISDAQGGSSTVPMELIDYLNHTYGSYMTTCMAAQLTMPADQPGYKNFTQFSGNGSDGNQGYALLLRDEAKWTMTPGNENGYAAFSEGTYSGPSGSISNQPLHVSDPAGFGSLAMQGDASVSTTYRFCFRGNCLSWLQMFTAIEINGTRHNISSWSQTGSGTAQRTYANFSSLPTFVAGQSYQCRLLNT